MADDSAGRSSGSAFSLTTSRGWVSAQSTSRSPSSSSSSLIARPLSGGSSMYCSYSAIENSCSSSPMSSGPGPAVLSSLVMAPSLPQRPAGHAGALREFARTGDEGLGEEHLLVQRDHAGLPARLGEHPVVGRGQDELVIDALLVRWLDECDADLAA